MRTKLLIVAAGVLVLTIGCGGRRNNTAYYPQEEAVALGPPRVNLYPLTAPPPGSAQPLQGYAPTRISATQASYAPPQYQQQYQAPAPAYAGGPAYAGNTYAAASYNPGMGITEPFPTGNYCPPWMPPGSNCTVEDMRAGMNPIVPIGDPPIIVNNVNTGQSYASTYQAQAYQTQPAYQTQSYVQQPYTTTTTYATTTYPTTTYPVSSTMGYSTSSHATSSSGTADFIPYDAPIGEPPFMVNNTYVASPYATTQPASYTAPVNQPLSSVATIPASYTPPTASTASTGSYSASQLRLVPAPDVPSSNRPGDAAPSQWFEIVRPDNGPIRIGRLSSTCVCVSLRVPNRFIAAGERALVEARIVSKPPVNNLTYGIYVGVVEPVQTTLDADVTITLR